MDELTKKILIKCAELCEEVYPDPADFLYDDSIKGHRILAIEGTYEKTDWYTNIKFLFRNEDMHRGFKANAERTLVELISRGDALPDKRRLVLTGHSLGGATATCLADLLSRTHPDAMIVTFGSPRPGGRKLRHRMAIREHYRYRHGDDVVPLTPPWIAGYVHTCPKIHLPAHRDCWWKGVSDHSIKAYKEELIKQLQ